MNVDLNLLLGSLKGKRFYRLDGGWACSGYEMMVSESYFTATAVAVDSNLNSQPQTHPVNKKQKNFSIST